MADSGSFTLAFWQLGIVHDHLLSEAGGACLKTAMSADKVPYHTLSSMDILSAI